MYWTLVPKSWESWNMQLSKLSVEQLLRNATHKGSDVRLATGTLHSPGLWPRRTIEASRWKWRVVLSYRADGDHINVAELKAVFTSIRWRLRSAKNVACRAVHLLDSQVALSVLVKGRSSSWQLQKVLHKINCLVLGSSLTLAYAYVRTDLNPADRPSRWPSRAVPGVIKKAK